MQLSVPAYLGRISCSHTQLCVLPWGRLCNLRSNVVTLQYSAILVAPYIGGGYLTRNDDISPSIALRQGGRKELWAGNAALLVQAGERRACLLGAYVRIR